MLFNKGDPSARIIRAPQKKSLRNIITCYITVAGNYRNVEEITRGIFGRERTLLENKRQWPLAQSAYFYNVYVLCASLLYAICIVFGGRCVLLVFARFFPLSCEIIVLLYFFTITVWRECVRICVRVFRVVIGRVERVMVRSVVLNMLDWYRFCYADEILFWRRKIEFSVFVSHRKLVLKYI